MAKAKLFDLVHQMTFYGAYHSNKVNTNIHIAYVPLILGTAQIFLARLPYPWSSDMSYRFGKYLLFEPNWAAILTVVYLAYYYALEPLAALMYTPQLCLSFLFMSSFVHHPQGLQIGVFIHVLSWIAQFIGHGVYEGRSPALLDNLLGAVVLAPFFVHLEVLFKIGYKPQLHREIENKVGVQISKFRGEERQKKSS